MKCDECKLELTAGEIHDNKVLAICVGHEIYDDPWRHLCGKCRKIENDMKRYDDMVSYSACGS